VDQVQVDVSTPVSPPLSALNLVSSPPFSNRFCGRARHRTDPTLQPEASTRGADMSTVVEPAPLVGGLARESPKNAFWQRLVSPALAGPPYAEAVLTERWR